MEYTKKSFTVGALPTEQYRSEWERIFRAPKPMPRSCPKCASLRPMLPRDPDGTCAECRVTATP